MTIRNLRIREDRAKYLYNLDVNSAYYDPKREPCAKHPIPTFDLKTQSTQETISPVHRGQKLELWPICNSSPGRPRLEATISTCKPTRLPTNASSASSRNAKKSSKPPPREAYWTSTVERNTLMLSHLSC